MAESVSRHVQEATELAAAGIDHGKPPFTRVPGAIPNMVIANPTMGYVHSLAFAIWELEFLVTCAIGLYEFEAGAVVAVARDAEPKEGLTVRAYHGLMEIRDVSYLGYVVRRHLDPVKVLHIEESRILAP